MTTSEALQPIVLDASVGVPLAWAEPASPHMARQLADFRSRGHRLLVPSVFWLEVMNVLGRRYHAPPPAMLEAIVELEAAGIETVELDRPMLLLALDAMVRHGLTAYDAAYLALADAADALLLTSGGALAAAAGTRARRIGDRRLREPRARYRPGDPDWDSWPGAAAYLRELRARVIAGTHRAHAGWREQGR